MEVEKLKDCLNDTIVKTRCIYGIETRVWVLKRYVLQRRSNFYIPYLVNHFSKMVILRE